MIQSTDSQLSFAQISGEFPLASESFAEAGCQAAERSLESLGSQEITERVETARRIIREQGVICHAAGEWGGEDRPWKLDILPMVLPPAEWRMLETGIIQRANLLNLLLKDFYGLQTSLRNGWLPAPLVYANPQFLRSCHGIEIQGGNHLPFYAVDLARSPEGYWSVIADRTQTPSGLGFALENRAILSRVIPEVMQSVQPRSLSGVLTLVREALVALSPQNRENPTVVVLTPGPRNESYFEHTYLARMLGFTLVEGGDLTVRDRRVFIKTLEGLRAVDVILRRVSDTFCDPLELRGDSLLGVPGLLEAVRAGNVSIGNALGCGLAETPALNPFLPDLCLQFLGEELLLPPLSTWWCGGAQALRHATSNLDRLAIRPAFSLQSEAASAYPVNRQLLNSQLQDSPHEWIAQEEAVLSSTRLSNGTYPDAAPFVLRVFVIGVGSTFHVIPGGLALLRQQPKTASALISIASNSKDVWILPETIPASEPEFAPQQVPTNSPEPAPIDIPSRIADNLFWLGRYTERLENLLRITRCVLGHVTNPLGVASVGRITVLHDMMTHLGLVPEDASAGGPAETLTEVVLGIISSSDQPDGVQDVISRIHQSAFTVRDRLSADTWRLFNRLRSDGAPGPGNTNLLASATILDTLVLDLAAFSGMEMENMTRGHGWMFLEIGRRLERSINLLELIGTALGSVQNALLYEPLLEICDSVITYRHRHFDEIRLGGILELLLFDGDNPRSLTFQFAALQSAAASLPDSPNPQGVANVRRLIAALDPYLHSTEIKSPMLGDSVSFRLMEIHGMLQKISELLSQVYFSHIIPRVN